MDWLTEQAQVGVSRSTEVATASMEAVMFTTGIVLHRAEHSVMVVCVCVCAYVLLHTGMYSTLRC